MLLKPIEVCSLFKCLNDHKSSLGIPSKLIKIAAQPLSIPLKYIYNQSIETGIVSHILKVSQIPQCIRVVMLQTLATLSPFSKVLERVVCNPLYSLISEINTKSCTNISLDLGKDIPLNKLFLKLLTI